MKLHHKLTAVFLLLSIFPVMTVGVLAYSNIRQTIEQNTVSRLVATNILKEAEFNHWHDANQSVLRNLAQRPLVKKYTAKLLGLSLTDPDYQVTAESLLQDHFLPVMRTRPEFYEVVLLRGDTGLVLASSNPSLIGQYRKDEPYLLENPADILDGVIHLESPDQGQAIHISTPVNDENGQMLAILTGHIDLAEMTAIMLQESGLYAAEESYIVNRFGLFVTHPRLGSDLDLQKAILTAGIQNCLAQNNGFGYYLDYRNVPVIGAYSWIAAQKMCILTEIDQDEAFAPVRRLQGYILLAGVIIGVLVAGVGVVFARNNLTTPLQELAKGAQEIGHGNLDYRIPLNRRDELGQLAAAFNDMAAQRQRMERKLRDSSSELEMRVLDRTMALRKSENNYRQLAETAQDIILTHALDGRITYINRTGMELSQYTWEDIAKMSVVDLVTTENVPQLNHRVARRLERDDSVFRFEVNFVTKHGQNIPLEVVSSLLTREDEPDEVLILARDIRERKAAEQALAQRAEELARSNAELEQFAYIASHDLQEPLRMVTSYLHLLERRYRGSLDDNAQEFIGFAIDGANRMKALINGLLIFSRVGTRSQPPAPISCDAFLERALANLELAISDKQAVITHDPLPTVFADGFQLEQLWQNLLSNALKFNSAAPPQIHVGARQQDGMWRFWVRDNGIGIEPAYQEQIFDIFKRLHTRDEYSGTGIGLAICKKIVERHGGQIWVESQPGQGATFFFTLPAASPPDDVAETPEDQPEAQKR